MANVWPPKIICVGLEKTGLTSLANALLILGIPTLKSPYELEYMYLNDSILGKKPFYRYPDKIGFADYPIPRIYKVMDRAYPDSKFILTVREEEQWLRSGQNFFTEVTKYVSKETVEQWQDSEEKNKNNLERYRKHNEDVRLHFRDKPYKLLEMNICTGDGWEKLCPFLEKEVPSVPFPHENKGKSYGKE